MSFCEGSSGDLAKRRLFSQAIREVMGSIFVGDSDFSFVPRSRNNSSFLCLSELKIYNIYFFVITHGAFDIADPSSMQDACHNKPRKYGCAHHESPSSSLAIERPTSVRNVMGSIFVGDSDFSFVPRS